MTGSSSKITRGEMIQSRAVKTSHIAKGIFHMVGNFSISSSNLIFSSIEAEVEGSSSTSFSTKGIPEDPLDSNWPTVDTYQHLDPPLEPSGWGATQARLEPCAYIWLWSPISITGRMERDVDPYSKEMGDTVTKGKGEGADQTKRAHVYHRPLSI